MRYLAFYPPHNKTQVSFTHFDKGTHNAQQLHQYGLSPMNYIAGGKLQATAKCQNLAGGTGKKVLRHIQLPVVSYWEFVTISFVGNDFRRWK